MKWDTFMHLHEKTCSTPPPFCHTAPLRPVVPSSVHSPARLHFGPVLLLSSSILYSYSNPAAVATTTVT
jgi:hypothetical protein